MEVNLSTIVLLIAGIGFMCFLFGSSRQSKETDEMLENWRKEADKSTAVIHFVVFNSHRFSAEEMENFAHVVRTYGGKDQLDEWSDTIEELE